MAENKKSVRTSLHILPFGDKGEEYLVLYLDEKAHAEMEAGNDNPVLKAFHIKANSDSSILNLVIDLVDGVPVHVHSLQEKEQ